MSNLHELKNDIAQYLSENAFSSVHPRDVGLTIRRNERSKILCVLRGLRVHPRFIFSNSLRALIAPSAVSSCFKNA